MSEPTKVSPEQLEAIREITSLRENLIHDLGKNEFNQIKLKNERAGIENYLKDLEQKDADLYKQISKQFGNVSVNLETGEIIPVA